MNREQARQLVRESFTHAFEKEKFRRFVRELLNRYDENKAQNWSKQYIPDAFKSHIERYERLGTYTAPDGDKLDILVVYLTKESKLERARAALRNFVAHHLKKRDEKDAGLVAFVSPTEQTWRFSFVRMEYETELTEAGVARAKLNLTSARRFSYLVGEGESCHTAQSRFLDLLQETGANPTLENVAESFSVETVTKEFFARYYALFKDLKEAIDRIATKDKVVGAELHAKGVNTADFAKKLLGQIVFLYFIQKKGWLGVQKGQEWGTGPRDFLRRLARSEYGNFKNMFNEVFEPLFYDTLATDRGAEAWCATFKTRIPFLNGGLFEPISGYDWKKTDLTLPNDLFFNSELTPEGDRGTGVLDVFDRYNFTVNEAEPLEQEVAIDPEMLGKVFENLLEAESRKSLGTFYTPREIVHYMCQESLISYLYRAVNVGIQPIVAQKPVQGGLFGEAKPVQTVLETPGIEERVAREDLAALIHLGDQAAHYEAALKAGTTSYEKKVRPRLPKSIEDHAREIDEALRDIAMCDPAIGSGAFPVGMMTEIVRARLALNPYFEDVAERSAYHFKRHAIHSCIYGVDIDRGAVEIAKLRLWLSLVVDEEDPKEIRPLPNLDFKVVAGNSLLGFPFQSQGLTEIEALKTQYFDEPDHDRKLVLKENIDHRISQHLAQSEKSLGYRVDFDYRLFFSEVFRAKRGFDVVIGNPPYIRIQNIEPEYAKEFKRRYKAASGKFDIYVLFVEAAFGQINNEGIICLIHPHRFLTADYGRGLKGFLDTVRGLRCAILFGVEQVFETATTYTGVFFYGRANENFQFKHVTTKDFAGVPFECRPYVEDGSHWIMPTETAGSTALVIKLKSQARPLTSIVSGIYQGIVTVGDDIFVLKGRKKGKYFIGYSVAAGAMIEIEAELVKPLVKGEHIRRYGKLDSDLGIIYPHYGDERGRTIPYTEAEMKASFPLAYAYFKPFKKHLVEKKIKYKTNPESWFSLHRARDKTLFDGRKIITPQLQNMPHFTLDEEGWYPDAGGYSLVGSSTRMEELFLLGVVNSKALWYFIKNTSNPYNNSYYYFKTKYLEPFTVPACSDSALTKIAEMAEEVLASTAVPSKQTEGKRLQSEIDVAVYKLFRLSDAEVDAIESAAAW